MDYEQKLSELYIDLPGLPLPKGTAVSAVASGKFLFIDGCLPIADGKLVHKGRLGLDVTLDQGVQAARYALIQGLSAVQQTAGSINKIKQIVRLTGFIATGGEFKDHDRVLEGAGQLLKQIFGSAGLHSRAAVGVASLPQGASVSLSLIVEIR